MMGEMVFEKYEAAPKIKQTSYDLIVTILDLIGLEPTEKVTCHMTNLIRTKFWTRKETWCGDYKVTIERIK